MVTTLTDDVRFFTFYSHFTTAAVSTEHRVSSVYTATAIYHRAHTLSDGGATYAFIISFLKKSVLISTYQVASAATLG